MKNTKLKAVLFDHDGTLVDSEHYHYKLWKEILETYGIDFTEADYIEFYAGVPTPLNAVDMVERYQLAESSAVLEDLKNSHTRNFLSSSVYPLMPGANSAISRLSQSGLKLAIVTGANREGLRSTVEGHELEPYFDCLVSADDVERSKPAPDCYLLALKRLGINADECVAVEDTETGTAAAVGAGISCLAVPTALSIRHNFDSATCKFKNLEEVVEWILERMRQD